MEAQSGGMVTECAEMRCFMNTVTVRGVSIGEGCPKICIPIVGTTEEEIIKAAGMFHNLPVDVAEWRVDWFEEAEDRDRVMEVLALLRKELQNIPILFTFRTLEEGGQRFLSPEDYEHLNQAAAESGCADLIDVELLMEEKMAQSLVEAIHRAGAKVIMSSHDFQKTPSQKEIIEQMCRMQELGADIPKIAVMPQNERDVLTLLSATEEMRDVYADRPIITMSMSSKGVISRVAGETFGSAMTFGAAKRASAPGQLDVEDLDRILHILHSYLQNDVPAKERTVCYDTIRRSTGKNQSV